MKITSSLLVACAVFAASPSFATDVTAEHAYARASGMSAKAGAAFLVLHNNGETPLKLVGATTDTARKAELHTHIIDDNGVAKMREIEGGITIPAGGAHVFERGADHIMLMGLTEALTDGKTVAIELIFEGDDPAIIEVEVDNDRAPEGHGAMDHSKMDHSGNGNGATTGN